MRTQILALKNSRKTERGAKQFLTGLVVRAAPFALLAVVGTGCAYAQLAEEFTPPRANCCLINNARGLANSASGLADQLQDWNQLSRYHQANEDLNKKAAP